MKELKLEESQEEPIKKLSFIKKIGIILLCLLILFFCYARLWIHTFLKVEEYPIIKESLPSNWNGFKIAQFSDIHFGRTTNERELDNMVEKLNKMKADIVVFTGDLFDDSITLSDKNIDYLKKTLANINANIMKLAILGDSDAEQKEKFQEIMNEANFQILENQNVLVLQKGTSIMQIAGISSIQTSEYDLQKCFETSETNIDYKILLAHEPEIIDDASIEDIDLILSGHSLGGLIRIPLIGNILKKEHTYDYQKGMYQKDHVTMYVSSGIGTEKYSYRTFNTPSINLYRFYNYN